MSRYTFDQCLEAFETSRVGKGPDGAMAIKVQSKPGLQTYTELS